MHEVKEKIQKLDILEDILSRLVDMEAHCQKLDSDICGIKTEIKDHTSNIVSLDKGLSGLHLKVQEIETQNMSLTDENYKLQETIIDQQKRSMRENLIFKRISNEHNPTEITEEKVKDFIERELGLESEEINFHVVHRLKIREDRSPRSIIAKFERRKDRNKVLEAAKNKLKQKPEYYVHEQFPVEIIKGRRKPIPILKDALLSHNEITHDTSQDSTTIKWNDNKRNEFVNTFHNSQDQLTNIMNDLENIYTHDTCTQQDIDNVTGEINELFHNTAKTTLSKPHYKSRKKPNSKPWYTNKCLSTRKKNHKARKHEATRKQLLETKTLYDYFKSVNENNVHDEIDIDIDVNNLPPDIEELLNSPITVDEIKCAVKNLKNNKSADMITY
ncbi:unnamed protein product [Mytilus coruscus]|uniref:Uncharacterized protein n=1 Tax=Mytilus coruscus TaxID=42192 RepID=A0A6J8CCM5_MYTCO|nr:unnamed protein product [Mytilus coruscus]